MGARRAMGEAAAGLALAGVLAGAGCLVEAEGRDPGPPRGWPPRVGQPYPDLQLRNPRGEVVSLASLKGRVLLVEPIAMDCPACNAFAGGNRPGVGGFGGARPQADLPSLDEVLRDYGGVSPADGRLVRVQLLLYDPERRGPPSPELARRWARHFGIPDGGNTLVLVGDDRLLGPAAHALIPGLQLVDRDFVLRYDATGRRPRHDLWSELVPALPGLLAAVQPAATR